MLLIFFLYKLHTSIDSYLIIFINLIKLETVSLSIMFYFLQDLHTTSILKYMESSFALGQIVVNWTKFIQKNINI